MCKRKQLPPQAINDKPGWDATTPLETGTVHSWTHNLGTVVYVRV